jgi:hypothetical protein
MKNVLELQLSLQRNCNFKNYFILFVLHSHFEHYIKNGGVVVQFHIKKFLHMGWINPKVNSK